MMLWWRKPEEEVLPALEELGLIRAIQPLGRALTGKSMATTFDSSDFRNTVLASRRRLENLRRWSICCARSENAERDARSDRPRVACAETRIVPIPGTTNCASRNIGALA
jgi:hypothetical protein